MTLWDHSCPHFRLAASAYHTKEAYVAHKWAAHPLVPPPIPIIIHLRHGSIALPMLGVPKMSVGVSLPHFTSPSSNGGQIGFRLEFFFSSALALTQKKNWGYTRADTQT